MSLGRAVYLLIAGRAPEIEDDPRAMVRSALDKAGGVSQLARALGIARTTVQRWNKGSVPTQESQELLRAALRREAIADAVRDRYRVSNALTVTGVTKDRPRGRTVDLGRYLAPGTMGRAVEAYLRGASPHELHIIVWAGITDTAYRGMFAPPGGIARADPTTQGHVYRAALGGGTGEPLAGGGGGGYGGGRLGDDDDDDDFADYDDSDLAYEGFDADDSVYSMTVSSAA